MIEELLLQASNEQVFDSESVQKVVKLLYASITLFRRYRIQFLDIDDLYFPNCFFKNHPGILEDIVFYNIQFITNLISFSSSSIPSSKHFLNDNISQNHKIDFPIMRKNSNFTANTPELGSANRIKKE